MKNIPHHPPINTFLTRSQRRVLALLAILALFLMLTAWSVPHSSLPSEPGRAAVTHTSRPTITNLINTPSLEEMQSNHAQTDGIAIFGGIIVIVIVAGTFFVLRRKS
jgi:hypothetical protein